MCSVRVCVDARCSWLRKQRQRGVWRRVGRWGPKGRKERKVPRHDRVCPSQDQPLTATRIFPFPLRSNSKTIPDHYFKGIALMRHHP
jgi:hypothetical protein